MLLANTGKLGTETPPTDNGGGHGLWVRSKAGQFYQCHDIGNVILMYPAAWVSSILSKSPVAARIQSPPILARVATALTYSVLSAVGCFFMFRLFALYYSVRTAFLLSFGFVTTTIFWPYTKSAWDVLGASCFVCILLYFSARLLTSHSPLTSAINMGLAAAFACSFRFSLTPFLLVSVGIILYYSRRNISVGICAVCAVAFITGIFPTLVYNYVRMGSPLRPATMAEAYVTAGTADISGNIFSGLYGLIISPNKGLLIFAPIFVLLLFLPFVWKKTSLQTQQICTAFGIGAVLHILFLAKIRGWGSFGWGPRYLVSVLPILFFLASVPLKAFWKTNRPPLIALSSLSAALCLAPSLVNWHLALTEYPQALNPYALLPYQHMAVWKGVFLGLQGRPLPAPEALLSDPIRSGGARFPDLWTVRLMEHSHTGLVIGLLISTGLIVAAIWAFRQLIRQRTLEMIRS